MNTTDKKCRNCFFGYPIDGGERAECHASRPTITRGHFPIVRGCDYCSFWADEETLDRPLSFAKFYTSLNVTTNGDEERGE